MENSPNIEQYLLSFIRKHRSGITILLILSASIFSFVLFHFKIDIIVYFSTMLGVISLWICIVTCNIAQTIKDYKSMDVCKSSLSKLAKELTDGEHLTERISDETKLIIKNIITFFEQSNKFNKNKDIKENIANLQRNINNKKCTNRVLVDTINYFLERL